MRVRLIFLHYLFFFFLLILFYSAHSYADVSGSLTGTTDYIWRGYSKSDEKPSIQGNIDYEFESGIYLGVFASTVNFADDEFEDRSYAEFRPYLGWAYTLTEDWRFNAEWTRYIYNGKIFGEDVDYNEFYIFGHFRDLLSANFGFSEDSYQQGHMSFNYEITGRYPITDSLEFSSTFGYSNLLRVLDYDYLYWNIGLTWHVFHNMGIDIRYYDGIEFEPEDELFTRWQFDPDVVNNSVVFSITVGF